MFSGKLAVGGFDFFQSGADFGFAFLLLNAQILFLREGIEFGVVSRELAVDYVLEGSVRKAGKRIRVTGQLVNCKDGNHVWAERFDRDLTDIFAIQDEITNAIVEQLKVRLLPREKKSIEKAPTDNIEAYTHYLRGRDFLHSR